MKKYNVTWSEKHSMIVDAKNEKDAIEKANQGLGGDESAEIDGAFEAYELD